MKYVEMTEEMDKTLSTICDAALKSAGMQAIALVNQLIQSIKDDASRAD